MIHLIAYAAFIVGWIILALCVAVAFGQTVRMGERS